MSFYVYIKQEGCHCFLKGKIYMMGLVSWAFSYVAPLDAKKNNAIDKVWCFAADGFLLEPCLR